MSCSVCSGKLVEPYIHCAECTKPSTDLCLICFVTGRETGTHVNSHNYEIRSLVFTLFEDRWSARDELNLLNATEEHGFGNWEEISKKVGRKTSEECQAHYLKFYINGSSSFIPKFEVNREQCWRRSLPLKKNDYRPSPDASHDSDVLSAVGYMAPRADFCIEYDNFAELDLKETEITTPHCTELEEHEDEDLIVALNLSVADIYYRRLQERKLRKKVLRKYGLLDIACIKSLECRNNREEKVIRDALRKFMRFLHPDSYEQIVHSILFQKQIEARVELLKEYRNAGLKTFRNVCFYEKFKKQRQALVPKNKLVDEALLHKENPLASQVWLQRQLNRNKSAPAMPAMPPINRKPSAPLNLEGTPQYDVLTDAEKNLCSAIRLMPEMYLEYRSMLQRESFLTKSGVRLQTARDLFKMDVNKTKRLYDFCVAQGFIVGDQT